MDDPQTTAAWHGTLLPKTDAESGCRGFAQYERIVALENALRKRSKGELTAADRERLAVALFAYAANYTLGARAGKEVPLAQTAADLRNEAWYRVAEGKGVLLLHDLRAAPGIGQVRRAHGRFRPRSRRPARGSE